MGFFGEKKMADERAYRRSEWKAREERRRIGADDDMGKKKPRKEEEPEDYDKSDVPEDYRMPVAILMEGRLMVGPPCVTKRQKAYLRTRLGNPALVPLELPPLDERKMWKQKELVTWFNNYARQFVEIVGRPTYLYHETGGKEEALVGMLVWRSWASSQDAPPKTQQEFLDWREQKGYLWFLDQQEETLTPFFVTVVEKKKSSEVLLASWLGKGKKK